MLYVNIPLPLMLDRGGGRVDDDEGTYIYSAVPSGLSADNVQLTGRVLRTVEASLMDDEPEHPRTCHRSLRQRFTDGRLPS